MSDSKDPILNSIVRELVAKHGCHTVILYGSRARGLATATSDYDVFGVRKRGEMFRIAKKQSGFFWDVFVYPESDLKQLGEERFSWKNAQILFQKGTYGTKLLLRIEKLLRTSFKQHEKYEIQVIKIWARKQIERCRADDVQGLFRRTEFLSALIEHYFYVRQKRYLGPKEGLSIIESRDPKTFDLLVRALTDPTNLLFLKEAAEQVYRIKL